MPTVVRESEFPGHGGITKLAAHLKRSRLLCQRNLGRPGPSTRSVFGDPIPTLLPPVPRELPEPL